MKKLLKITLLPLFILIGFTSLNEVDYLIKKNEKVEVIEQSIDQEIDSLIEQQQIVKNQLISEAKNYILETSKTANVEIIAPNIVEHGLGNNIDLCFILAQCQIETVFGTKGMGRAQSKKSMFGVGRTYKSYEDCIIHYTKLIRDKYLGNTKTIFHLMNHYVNLTGHRYAEDRNYESKLKSQYTKIVGKTKIGDLEQQYRLLEEKISKLKGENKT